MNRLSQALKKKVKKAMDDNLEPKLPKINKKRVSSRDDYINNDLTHV